MSTLRRALIDWWRRRRRGRARVDQARWYATRADLPEDLPRNQLALIGEPSAPKWAVLECPCGAGHRLQLNLSALRSPHWRMVTVTDAPSLFPSIDFHTSQRRCHFWLREGRVDWVGNSGRRQVGQR
jgi:Family of unknown function (DUF6527)